MIGGGGERVTLRIVAKHADHWNVWGGPQVLARKGKILDEHCAAVGRDPKTITRSVNMALLITDKKDEVERLAKTIETRMGRHAADARDTCLAGTPDQIREQLHAAQGRRRRARCSSRACSGPLAELRRISTASSRRSPRRSASRRPRAPAIGRPAQISPAARR